MDRLPYQRPKPKVKERVTNKPSAPRKRVHQYDQNKTCGKRPDVKKRIEDGKSQEEFVVEASLSGRIKSQTIRPEILEVIDDYVGRISKMVVRGGMIANEFIMESFSRDVPIPTLNQTFFRRCLGGYGGEIPLLNHVIETRFGDHPDISRDEGVRCMLNFASVQFKTIFDNNLWMNFTKRMITYVREWCLVTENDLPDVITSVILGFPIRTHHVLSRQVHQFIEEGWRILYPMINQDVHISPRRSQLASQTSDWARSHGIDPAMVVGLVLNHHESLDHVDKDTRKLIKTKRKQYADNPVITFYPQSAKKEILLLQMCLILQWKMVHNVGRGFPIVPMFKVKRHHINICTSGLHDILKAVGRRAGIDVFPEDIQSHLLSKKPCDEPCRSALWDFVLDRSNLHAKGEFSHFITTDGVKVSIHYKRPKRQVSLSADIPTKPTEGERVIGNDPGRIHLFTGFERAQDGSDIFYSFSRKAYYSALKPSLDKMRRWEGQIRDVYTELSQGSLKTLDPQRRATYIRVYCTQFNRLWDLKLRKKFARETFHISSTKRGLLDRFFASFVKTDKRQPTIIYGASSTKSHGRGELAVPVKKMLQTCRRFYKTILVDEYLTTRCHSKCKNRMHDVKNVGSRKSIHGLLWCPNCNIFVNRDRDASKCIEEIGVSDERPWYLSRAHIYEPRDRLTLLPRQTLKRLRA